LSDNDGTSVRAAFAEAGQGQVFRFWERLDPGERNRLIHQASEIDLAELEDAVRQALEQSESASDACSDLEPAPWIPLPADTEGERRWREVEGIGEDLLRMGKVAAFTVAGGQGTRLGYDGPKGAFPVTPVSKKPLFQVFAERLKAAERRYGKTTPWFVMTSEANHERTKTFFEERDFFDLGLDAVHFLRQGMMPAVLETGEIMLERPDRIAMNPDGHGGAFRVLTKSGAAKNMQEAGIEVITYFQVDNPLAPFLEPAFLGFHASSGSEMSSRAAPKTGPEEKVGVFCLRRGALTVIEYSDLPDELAHLREEDGTLIFQAGSLAMHAIDPVFAERVGRGEMAFKLPSHAARKKVPTIDKEGNPIFPDEPNGIKLETFVFDAIPLAKQPCVVEVARKEAFSPVKNTEGVDSVDTCRADQLRRFARWAKAGGAELETDETGLPAISFEIDPGFAFDEREFARRWKEAGEPAIEEGLVFDENFV